MEEYDDIINLRYEGVKQHQRMSMEARAAQFAPFAALTGHDQAIASTARSHEESFNKPTVDDDDDLEYPVDFDV